jgi:hypothetical protein
VLKKQKMQELELQRTVVYLGTHKIAVYPEKSSCCNFHRCSGVTCPRIPKMGQVRLSFSSQVLVMAAKKGFKKGNHVAVVI